MYYFLLFYGLLLGSHATKCAKNEICYTLYNQLPIEFHTRVDRGQWLYYYFLFQENPDTIQRIIAQDEQGAIIGAVSFSNKNQQSCEILFLEVVEAYQNKRVGTQLLQRAIAQLCSQAACEKVCWRSSPFALAFYKKLGYTSLPANLTDNNQKNVRGNYDENVLAYFCHSCR